MQVVHWIQRRRGKQSQRRGFALIGVMICFVVVSMLVVSWLKNVSIERQQARTIHERLQAEWLANAAVERAIARAGEKAGYTGETWNIPAAELDGGDSATVEIKVAPLANHPDRREIRVVADYPADPIRRVRRSRQLVVDLSRISAVGNTAASISSGNVERSK